MELRPYRDGDAAGVAALLEDGAPDFYRSRLHSLHGPGRDEPSRWRTKVAVGADGAIAGAVTAAHHSVHRGQYVLAVTVAPGSRRRGLGRELAAEGFRMRAEPLPMTTRFLGTDEVAAAFVRSLGGRVVQTGPRFSADPAGMLEWADAQPVPAGAAVGDLTGTPPAELAGAHRDMYVWQHEGWTGPPISLPAVAAHSDATAAITRRELSSVARVDGRLAAFAIVIEEDDGLTLISETTRRDEPAGRALVAAVVADSLRRLAAAGAPRVEFEGHVTDPHLHPVTQTFPPGLPTDPIHVVRFPG